MTQSKDDLLELCKPFLLDLAAALFTTIQYPDKPMSEPMDKLHRLKTSDYDNINDLSETRKIGVLHEILNWLKNDQPNNQ